MPIVFFWVVVFIIAMSYVLSPILNRFFSMIWSEEERPMVKKETQDRLNELFIDGDVPDETGLIMAAKEQGVEEEELLAMFEAIDAKDLKEILTAKGPNKLMKILQTFNASSTKGMRKRR